MKTRIITLLDDIIILEIKTSNRWYEYYIRSDNYPFEFVFGVEEQFNRSNLMRLLANDYFNLWLEEH